MYGVKEKLCRTSFTGMTILFSSDFVLQYLLDIFSKLKKKNSHINSENAEFSTKSVKSNRTTISFNDNVWYQRTSTGVKFYVNGHFILICNVFFASTG